MATAAEKKAAEAEAEKTQTEEKVIRVTSKVKGFRRAGRSWSGSTDLKISELTKDQLDQLNEDPMLIVEKLEIATK